MNTELIEKVTATREYLASLAPQVTDVKKLAEHVRQNAPMMERAAAELCPYMTVDQKSRFVNLVFGLDATADHYLRTGKGDTLAELAMRTVPLILADLDACRRKVEGEQ